jgi:hypothetical protein
MSHHFDDGDIEIGESKTRKDHWDVTFKRKGTKVKITMKIPKTGIFDDPSSTHVLSKDEVMVLAKVIGCILRIMLAK